MIEDAKNGEIDLILTKSISRFSRNTVDALQTVRELRANNVEVYFEKENIHSMDSKGEMMLTILSSLAQEESRSISENVKWGKEKSMREGNVYMPYGRFLGYKKGEDGRPEIIEEEAIIIRSIYDMFLNGMSIHQIADYLTTNNIKTPSGKQKWSISTIKSILGNEKYKGEAILQKTFTADYLTKRVKKNTGEKPKYLIRNSHIPIIDPETFERVQRELERRKTYRRRYNEDKNHADAPKPADSANKGDKKQRTIGIHPFVNRLVCSDCGGYYGHKVWRSRGKNRIRYDVWYCNHKYDGEKKCETPTLKEEDIKKAFTKMLRKLAKTNQRQEREQESLSLETLKPEAFNEALWWKLVESVTITNKHKAIFNLTDGSKSTVTI